MSDKIFEVLTGKLEEEIKSVKQVLCDGGAKSYDHYKELSGKVAGLQIAQREIAEFQKKLRHSDED